MKMWDKYGIDEKKIRLIIKEIEIDTLLVTGVLGSAVWILTALIMALTFLIQDDFMVQTYAYLTLLTFFVLITIISKSASFILKIIVKHLNEKNDKDYELENTTASNE